MQVHTWTTASGRKVELHAEHITTGSFMTDDDREIETKENWVRIEKCLLDGKQYQKGNYIRRTKVQANSCLDLGNQVIEGNKVRLYVLLPPDVEAAVWGDYDRMEAAKKAKREAVAKIEREELKRKIANGYCTRCGSYCYGDCTAHK